MKSVQNWLDEYAESHQHPTNIKIHWICVPLIMLSIIGLLANIQILIGISIGCQIYPIERSPWIVSLTIRLSGGQKSEGIICIINYTNAKK